MLQVFEAQHVSDGAGVKLRRIIGHRRLEDANPFLMLDEFKSDDREEYQAGFPMHPHRGFETITYMVKGVFAHKDSKGHSGILQEGEVQWMTAGKGILHEEMPELFDGQLWGYQLWVNLPQAEKMRNPKYTHIKEKDIPLIEERGLKVKVIAGSYNERKGPARTVYPVDFFDVTLHGGQFVREAKEMNIIYVHSGSITIQADEEEKILHEGMTIYVRDVKRIKIQGDNGGFLLMSAHALNEPLVKYGPFVMNTEDEIVKALHDYQKGVLDK